MNERVLAQSKVETARKDLLIMIALTVVNVVLLALDSGVFMLFSASLPYYTTLFGIAYGIPFLYVIAAGSLLLYFLCWFFSKKHYGWLIAALALFIFDTIFLIMIYVALGDFSGILDFIIHALVIYYLVVGVINGAKLKKLPETTAAEEPVYTEYTQANTDETYAETFQADDQNDNEPF